jgi:hypothetical protein
MAKFTTSEWVDVDVSIDVDEFLANCSKSEIESIIDYLIDENIINESSLVSSNSRSIIEDQWIENIQKLQSLYLTISKEDEDIIKSIINKY